MGKFRYDIKTYMPQRYTDKNDLLHRINGTLCRYDGLLYLLQLGGGDPFASSKKNYKWDLINPLTATTVKSIDINDPLLDISSIEVGYYTCHASKQAYYLQRNPEKRYQQSLSPQNTRRATINGNNGGPWNITQNPGLLAALYDKFPSLSTARNQLAKDYKSVALSKDVAIEGSPLGITLVYVKTRQVGYFDENSRLIIPERDRSWLVRRVLSEVL